MEDCSLLRILNRLTVHRTVVPYSRTGYSLRAQGVSTAAARRPFSERGVQLRTTDDNFCRKMENVVLLSTTSEKSKISKNEIQYFIVQHFPFFRQKLSVVLNCTPRSEKGRRAAAVETPRARSLIIKSINQICIFHISNWVVLYANIRQMGRVKT